jgi:serine/threonine-protein kinase HipA
MRSAKVYVNKKFAGQLEEMPENKYVFLYEKGYIGAPISLTMPISQNKYEFDFFPPFFEGLLPEGPLLEGLLRKYKLDKNDYFGQLLIVGQDVVGAVSIEPDNIE